jgi:hypothetical protein
MLSYFTLVPLILFSKKLRAIAFFTLNMFGVLADIKKRHNKRYVFVINWKVFVANFFSI